MAWFAPIGCFTLFRDIKRKVKISLGLHHNNDKAKSHAKKCEQYRVTLCQQDFRLPKMHLLLILYSSLKVRQLKDLLIPLHLQRSAKYCQLMYSSTS